MVGQVGVGRHQIGLGDAQHRFGAALRFGISRHAASVAEAIQQAAATCPSSRKVT